MAEGLGTLLGTLMNSRGASPDEMDLVARLLARGFERSRVGDPVVVRVVATRHREVLERLVRLDDLGELGTLWFFVQAPSSSYATIDGLVADRGFVQACENLVGMDLAASETTGEAGSADERVRYMPTSAGRVAFASMSRAPSAPGSKGGA